MRRATCLTIATILVGSSMNACGSGERSRKAGEDDGGLDGASSQSPGSGGRGSGGRAGTGGRASGGAPGTGGATGSGGTGTTDAGAGGTAAVDAGSGGAAAIDAGSGGTGTIDAGSGGAVGTDAGSGGTTSEAGVLDAGSGGTDASADGSVADAAPETGTSQCFEAGSPVCDWFYAPSSSLYGAHLSGSQLELTVLDGVPDLAAATVKVTVCDCDLYGSYGDCSQPMDVPADVSADGRTITVDVSTLLSLYSVAWVSSVDVTATTVCGETKSFVIQNNGNYSLGACSDGLLQVLSCG